MGTASDPGFDLRSADERTQLEAFLDEYRRRLPDRLGLIKHMTFVENVWFSEAITCDGARERVADILCDQILAG